MALNLFRRPRQRHCPLAPAAPLLAGLLLILTLVVGGLPASAAEEIVLFDSTVTVDESGSLVVEENLHINVEGRSIRHGIFRDFPTTYRTADGKRYRVGFKVLAVTLDGRKEPYEVTDRSGGVRIRIGSADRYVPTGTRIYRITYRTTGQIGFFDDHDEVYWNVTGNGWEFPINRALARVILPEGVEARKALLFTGPEGSTASRGRWSLEGNEALFQTTAPLDAGEGLTVAVAFDKGHVTPSAEQLRLNRPPSPFLLNVAPFLALALLIAYYVTAWLRYGKDLRGGPIFARFEPPPGISPALASRLMHRRFNDGAVTASLIDLAVKGHLVIEEIESALGSVLRKALGRKVAGKFRLRKIKGDAAGGDERFFLSALFGSRDELDFTRDSDKETFHTVRESLKDRVNGHLPDYLRRNILPSLAGFVLSLTLFGGLLLANRASFDGLFSVLWLALWSLFAAFLFTNAFASLKKGLRLKRFKPAIKGLVLLVMALLFAFSGLIGAVLSAEELSPAFAVAIVGTFVVNYIFIRIMGNVTPKGRKLLDELEGLKLYLSVAEKERIRRFADVTLPPDTPEQFEKLLPWAIALDVEKEWAQHFESVLAERGYEPAWYAGRTSWHVAGITSMTSNLTSSLGGAIAAASTPPGSSSGFGGGGSSGGGGGGGGGGGW